MFVVEWGPGFRVAAEDHATVVELRRLCALRDDALSVLRICADRIAATPCCASDAADLWALTVPARHGLTVRPERRCGYCYVGGMCSGGCERALRAPAVAECGEVPGGHQSAEERASAPQSPASALASIQRGEGG